MGDYCFIDSLNGIKSIVDGKYTTPNGKRLIHVTQNMGIFTTYISWGYPKVSFLRVGFEKMMQRCIEFGITSHWEKLAVDLMKSEDDQQDQVIFEEKPLISAFTLDDLQGIFFLDAIILGLCVIFFVIEIAFWKLKGGNMSRIADQIIDVNKNATY